MNNVLWIAIIAGLGGMIGWGGADFFAKKTIDRIGPIVSLVWAHTFGSGVFILAALAQLFVLRHTVPLPSGSAWLGLMFFGALQMIVYWLVYQGFEKGQLAVLNPVFASFTGIVALVAIVFFHQSASLAMLLALIALFAGIILLNVDLDGLRSKKLKISPGLKEVGAATVLAALWTLGWDKFVSGHEPLSYALWMYVFMTVAAFTLAKLMRTKLRGAPKDLIKILFLVGLGEAVAYLAISWGYSSTNLTSIVALVSGAFSVPTVVLAYLFLKERITRLQVIAVVVVVAAICLIAIV